MYNVPHKGFVALFVSNGYKKNAYHNVSKQHHLDLKNHNILRESISFGNKCSTQMLNSIKQYNN